LNNESWIAFITVKCTAGEEDFVGDKDDAKTQVLLLREAFSLRYKKSEPLADTSTKIYDTVLSIGRLLGHILEYSQLGHHDERGCWGCRSS
jgi:hypothetical protein